MSSSGHEREVREREVEAFCRVEHPRLVAALTLYTGDVDLAAELAQEALARAHGDWAKVGTMSSPGGWASRVAFNLANSHFRRQKYERAARERAASRLPAAPGTPADVGDPDVLRAVAALPQRQREAVALRFLLDLSVEDTAARMGCAAGTVRALTSQAVARLRESPSLADVKDPSCA